MRSARRIARALGMQAKQVVELRDAQASRANIVVAFGTQCRELGSRGRHCLLGRARDRDGSGAVTLAEVAYCAQAFVHERISSYPNYLPDQVSVRCLCNLVPRMVSTETSASVRLRGPTGASP